MDKNRYANGKIYKIWSCDTERIYVGSTCDELHKRMYEHRKKCRTTYKRSNFKIYEEMNNVGVDTFRIELIEEYPCGNRSELLKREGYWIRELKAALNSRVAGRSREEYASDNKELIVEYKKQHYKANKDKFAQKFKEYRAENLARLQEYQSEKMICPVCSCHVSRSNMSRHRRTLKHKASVPSCHG